MITTNTTMQQISRRSTTTTETYDKEGNLLTREVFEEIEYVPVASTPNWYGQPLATSGMIPVSNAKSSWEPPMI